MARRSWWLHPAAKPLLFLLCLLPFADLLWGAIANTLGANPAEAVIRGLGDWALRFICITLAVTPLRVISNQPALARFRRMLGLFAFFYASLHLLAYGWLDQGLDLGEIARDIAKRPFILLGFTTWLLMLPLALSSFNRAIKALGAKRWQALHKTIYLLSLVAVAHFLWLRAGKNNFTEPLIYLAVLALLLGWRVWRTLKSRLKAV